MGIVATNANWGRRISASQLRAFADCKSFVDVIELDDRSSLTKVNTVFVTGLQAYFLKKGETVTPEDIHIKGRLDAQLAKIEARQALTAELTA